jgi:hypothetical protein
VRRQSRVEMDRDRFYLGKISIKVWTTGKYLNSYPLREFAWVESSCESARISRVIGLFN